MFSKLFQDNNNINEKSVVGFVAFAIMVLFALADLFLGFFGGKDLVINEHIYDSFLIITLGCFGIAEAGNILGNKKIDPPAPAEEEKPKNSRPDININIDGDDW